MSYHDLTTKLAERIAAGELVPGAPLPSVRVLAASEITSTTSVARAYRELAAAGAIIMQPRRVARVAHRGVAAAQAILRQGETFRLAGSDDPALNLLLST